DALGDYLSLRTVAPVSPPHICPSAQVLTAHIARPGRPDAQDAHNERVASPRDIPPPRRQLSRSVTPVRVGLSGGCLSSAGATGHSSTRPCQGSSCCWSWPAAWGAIRVLAGSRRRRWGRDGSHRSDPSPMACGLTLRGTRPSRTRCGGSCRGL